MPRPPSSPEHKAQKQKEAKARWLSKEENREKTRATAREYARKNRNKTPEAVEARREYQRAWCAANRAKKNNYGMLRHSRKLKATPAWLSESDLLRIKCIYEVAAMRNRESDVAWEVDHIVPLRGKKVCGLHVPWNLRVITAEENRRKGCTHASNV